MCFPFRYRVPQGSACKSVSNKKPENCYSVTVGLRPRGSSVERSSSCVQRDTAQHARCADVYCLTSEFPTKLSLRYRCKTPCWQSCLLYTYTPYAASPSIHSPRAESSFTSNRGFGALSAPCGVRGEQGRALSMVPRPLHHHAVEGLARCRLQYTATLCERESRGGVDGLSLVQGGTHGGAYPELALRRSALFLCGREHEQGESEGTWSRAAV